MFDTRTTVITKLTDCSGQTGAKSRLLRADLTVAYTYRGKQRSITLSTLREADNEKERLFMTVSADPKNFERIRQEAVGSLFRRPPES